MSLGIRKITHACLLGLGPAHPPRTTILSELVPVFCSSGEHNLQKLPSCLKTMVCKRSCTRGWTCGKRGVVIRGNDYMDQLVVPAGIKERISDQHFPCDIVLCVSRFSLRRHWHIQINEKVTPRQIELQNDK